MEKKIVLENTFIKSFKKRIAKNKELREKYKEAVALFMKSPYSIKLRNHPLVGKMKGLKAFYIDSDCRVIYEETKERYYFYDIGKHEEVYK